MKKLTVIVSFVAIIALIIGFLLISNWITNSTGYSVLELEKEKTAHCLEQKKATYFYDSAYCPDCKMQEDIFSIYLRFIPKIDCVDSPPECQKLTQVPAWKIEDKIHYGVFGVDELSERAEC